MIDFRTGKPGLAGRAVSNIVSGLETSATPTCAGDSPKRAAGRSSTASLGYLLQLGSTHPRAIEGLAAKIASAWRLPG